MPGHKPVQFRAVHTKTRWRKASHETLDNARSRGNRSARALFARENDVIDYTKHGDALFVVIWHENQPAGEVLKADSQARDGVRRSRPVPVEQILRWERLRGAPLEDLERYFGDTTQEQVSAKALETHIPDPLPTVPGTEEELEAQLHVGITESRSLSSAARRERLNLADPHALRIEVRTTAFLRNPDVIVEVLNRAGGRCEKCGEIAPFRRRIDNSPYLEVHHVVPLAQGGQDTVANAQALCPNCHRYLHFGSDVA